MTRRTILGAALTLYNARSAAQISEDRSLRDTPSACPVGKTKIDGTAPIRQLPRDTPLPDDVRKKFLELITQLTGFSQTELTRTTAIRKVALDNDRLQETRLDTIKAIAPLDYHFHQQGQAVDPRQLSILLLQDHGASAGNDLQRAAKAVGIITRKYAQELGIPLSEGSPLIAANYHELLRVVQEFSGEDLFTAAIGGGSKDLYQKLQSFIDTARLALTVAAAEDAVNNFSAETSRFNIASRSENGCVEVRTAEQLGQLPTTTATDLTRAGITAVIDNVLALIRKDTQPKAPTARNRTQTNAASPK